MSKISVWTSLGQWSEEIVGLDKVDFIKDAIQHEFSLTFKEWKERYKFYHEDDFSVNDLELNVPLVGLEINTKEVAKGYINDSPTEKEYVNWVHFQQHSNIDLAKARVFKLRLSTMQMMVDEATYLSPVYKELISAAKAPIPVSDGYCLLFKFKE